MGKKKGEVEIIEEFKIIEVFEKDPLKLNINIVDIARQITMGAKLTECAAFAGTTPNALKAKVKMVTKIEWEEFYNRYRDLYRLKLENLAIKRAETSDKMLIYLLDKKDMEDNIKGEITEEELEKSILIMKKVGEQSHKNPNRRRYNVGGQNNTEKMARQGERFKIGNTK